MPAERTPSGDIAPSPPVDRARRPRPWLWFGMGVCAIGLLELAVRLLVAVAAPADLRRTIADHARLADADTRGFVPAPYVTYRLQPDHRRVRGEEITSHNAHGFRGRDAFPPRTDDVVRVVCLGGSTTYGAGVHDDADAYPAQLERSLSAAGHNDVRGVEVFNLGVGGYTSAEVLANLHFHALPLEPDVVLVQCAINDVIPRLYPDLVPSYEHFRTPMKSVELSTVARMAYRSHLIVATGWAVGRFEPVTLQSRTQGPMPSGSSALESLGENASSAFHRNLSAIVTLARASGARVWLLNVPYLDHADFTPRGDDARDMERAYAQGLAEHNEIVRELARSMNVGLVDLARHTPQRRAFFTDPIHMTREGNAFKARFVADTIGDVFPGDDVPIRAASRD